MPKLPRWKKDDPITHADLNMLAEAIERADSLVIDTSNGLQLTETSKHRTLGLSLAPGCYHAVVTQQITLSSGLSLGRGRVQVYTETFDADDAGTLVPLDGPEWCYFAAPSGGMTRPIAVGQRIVVCRTAGGSLSVVTGYC